MNGIPKYKNDEIINICNSDKKKALNMIASTCTGHPGGTLSCFEIIYTLFLNFIDITKNNIYYRNRNNFILSKGHAAPTLYCVLNRLGIISDNELYTYRQIGSRLQGHPEKTKLEAIDCSTGSLGMGISVGCGMAIYHKNKKDEKKVYVLVGDGELQEGSNWEAILFSSHHKLDNLIVIVDNNGFQLDDKVNSILSLDSIEDKFISFGWETFSVDGHDVEALVRCFGEIVTNNKPKCIICNTIKGKGINEFENAVNWHSVSDCKKYKEIIHKYEN